jgi:hypothetical protein
MAKTKTLMLIAGIVLIVTVFSFGLYYLNENISEEIKESICYPEYFSVVNGEVLTTKPSYCEEVIK